MMQILHFKNDTQWYTMVLLELDEFEFRGHLLYLITFRQKSFSGNEPCLKLGSDF